MLVVVLIVHEIVWVGGVAVAIAIVVKLEDVVGIGWQQGLESGKGQGMGPLVAPKTLLICCFRVSEPKVGVHDRVCVNDDQGLPGQRRTCNAARVGP